MTLCLFFSLALPHLVGSLLPASLKCSPVRRAWDVRAAAMMAWRVSLPGCLFMAKLLNFASSVSPRRYRLVGIASSVSSRRAGRRADRIRHWLRHGDLPCARPVVPSRLRGSCPWRIAPTSCPRVSYLLAIITPSRPSSRFSSRWASRCACLALDVFFLCFSNSFAGVMCLLDLSPHSSCSIVSSSRLVLRLVGGGGSSCACLIDLFPMVFSSRFIVSSGGAWSGAGR